ncbi:hypothetical protein V8B97DRAFT_2002566 [Scleroderma yunnanense]
MFSSVALRVSLAARLVVPLASTRRTLLTTALLQSPPATTKKPPAKPNKSGKKQAFRVSKDDLPPKRPSTPFVLFFIKHTKDAATNGIRKDEPVTVLAKRAGEAWAAMTIAEKQPYFDEHETLKTQYEKAREQYFDNVDPEVLKAINKQRKARGLPRVGHVGLGKSQCLPSTTRFMKTFRDSSEGLALLQDKTNPEPRPIIRVSRAAGQRWRNMSDEDKYPFVVAYNRDKEALQANQTRAST